MPLEVEFTDNSTEILKAFEEQIDVALEAVGLQAEGYAKLKAPVDTGRLRNSITHVTDKNSGQAKSFTYETDAGDGTKITITDTTILTADKNQVVIGSNVEYAAYQEYGTKKTKAQPYLRPAVTEHTAEYKAIVEHFLKQ